MFDRRRRLRHWRRNTDQADEMIVVHRQHKNGGLRDRRDHEKSHHRGLHSVAEHKPSPARARLGKQAKGQSKKRPWARRPGADRGMLDVCRILVLKQRVAKPEKPYGTSREPGCR